MLHTYKSTGQLCPNLRLLRIYAKKLDMPCDWRISGAEGEMVIAVVIHVVESQDMLAALPLLGRGEMIVPGMAGS